MPKLTIGPSGEQIWSELDKPIQRHPLAGQLVRSVRSEPDPDDENPDYEDEREDDATEEEPDADDAETPDFVTHDLGDDAYLIVKGEIHPSLVERCRAVLAERV